MEFSIPKSSFSQLLYLTNSIVERRNTMPILANVKLSADNDKLTIAATDLEISLVGEAEAEVKSSGSITVAAKVLYEIVKELPEESVHLSVAKGQRLEVQSGQSRFKINGVSSEEFPSIVGTQLKDPISVEAAKLYEMLDKTAFAVSTDETRYNINGVCAESLEGQKTLRFVSTDGHRLALIDRPAEGLSLSESVIIPRKGIQELKKVLEGNDGAAQVGLNEGFFTIRCGGVTIGIRLVDGQFPDYRQVIPTQSSTIVEADRGELLSTVKRVSLVTTDRSKTVKFQLTSGKLTVSSSSPEYGEASDSIEVKQEGEDVTIGFSAKYVMDILAVMQGEDSITMKLNGDLGPGLFLGPKDEDYRCVVMPMRFE